MLNSMRVLINQIVCLNLPKDYIGSTINAWRTRMTHHYVLPSSNNQEDIEKLWLPIHLNIELNLENNKKIEPFWYF